MVRGGILPHLGQSRGVVGPTSGAGSCSHRNSLPALSTTSVMIFTQSVYLSHGANDEQSTAFDTLSYAMLYIHNRATYCALYLVFALA